MKNSSAAKDVEKGKESRVRCQLGENGVEGEWTMDINEQVDCKKKVESAKERVVKNSQGIYNECPDFPHDIREVLREKWQQELQDNEISGRNDLVPEHQKIRRRDLKKVAELEGQKRSSVRRIWSSG